MSKRTVFSRWMTLLVALAMLLSAAACAQTTMPAASAAPAVATTAPAGTAAATTASAEPEPTAAPKPELYTIKYFLDTKTIKKSDETEIGKVILDKFNVVFEYIPNTGDYVEKLNLMLAAGDYPDFLWLEGEAMFQKYLSAGVLLPLDDYLANAPNFMERYKDQLPYWRLSSPDRKLYKWEAAIPQDRFVNTGNNDILIRTDALQKAGWPKLLSVDDYVNFLIKAMQDIPTTNGVKTVGMAAPFAEPWGIQGILGCLFEKGDTYTGAPGNMACVFNYKEKKFEDVITNPYVKESYQFFNKLYRNGVMEKEVLTDKYDQFAQKVEGGLALAAWYATWEAGVANQKMIAAGHPELQYIDLPIQSNTMVAQGQKRQITTEGDRSFESIAITKNAKYPDRIFAMVEWAASEDAQILIGSGVKDVDWVMKDGKRAPSDAFVSFLQGNNPDFAEKVGLNCFNLLGHARTLAKDGVAYDLTADPVYRDLFGLTPGQKDAFQALGWATSTDWWQENGFDAPATLEGGVAIDPSTDLGKLQQQMVDVRVKYAARLVLASSDEQFETIYTQMLDEYDKLDHQKVVDDFNRQYQERASALAK